MSKLLKEKCNIKNKKIEEYNGKKIAIDAPVALYQFLIAVRSEGNNLNVNNETTSHLIGIFYRTIRFVEAGITPLYVFDGMAPEMKMNELMKRKLKREEADKKLIEAKEAEDQELIEKYTKRNVKVEEKHILEAQKLLTLLGIPWLIAESEAEAYCSFLCKKGYVDGVATEDMDALCFGCPILIRNLNAAIKSKFEIQEYNLNEILNSLSITMESFIDMCILLGCDYCSSIKNIGPKRAYDLITKYKDIESILEEIKENKTFDVEEKFNYEIARNLFKELGETGEEIDKKIRVNYESIDKIKIKEFLCDEKAFDETRVENGVNKIIKAKK